MEENNLKININQGNEIRSEKVSPELFFSLIASKKVGDVIQYKNNSYKITGATSENGTFHLLGNPKRGRVFYKKRKRKLMVESELLNKKTNQLFLKIV